MRFRNDIRGVHTAANASILIVLSIILIRVLYSIRREKYSARSWRRCKGRNALTGRESYLPPSICYFELNFDQSIPTETIRETESKYNFSILVETNGLIVPRMYDCSTWGSHDYSKGVPSRYIFCQNQFYMRSLKPLHIEPRIDIIDEEIYEMDIVLSSVIEARATNQFAFFEIGARWGTWGFRSLAAAKMLGIANAISVFYEIDLDYCEGIKVVGEINHIKDFKLICEAASPENIKAEALKIKSIDVMDFDIQGAEEQLIPAIKPMMNDRVKYAVIGTHSSGIHETIRSTFDDWILIHEFLMNENLSCVQKYFRGFNFSGVLKHQCYVNTSLGPICNWDGELILKNPKFL